MSKPNPIETIDFKNSFGHVIKPGDDVVSVTSGYCKSINIRTGKYVGVRKSSRYSRDNLSVVLNVNKAKTKFVHNVTGEKFDWNKAATENPYPQRQHWTNDPVLNAANSLEYGKQMATYREKETELKKDYSYKKFEFVGRTTLQLNRIFPLLTQLKDISI